MHNKPQADKNFMKNIVLDKFSNHSIILRGFAVNLDDQLLVGINNVAGKSNFRHMKTPNGSFMSAAMTNCGEYGWISDKSGYRYEKIDPQNNKPWPHMPLIFKTLARDAADIVGYTNFESDACLINRYSPKTSMSLHQDKDERDFSQPIVSVSLGLTVMFMFGGLTRNEKPIIKELYHGDVLVWGGPDRLRFHGVRPLKKARHPLVGAVRLNLTLRRAN